MFFSGIFSFHYYFQDTLQALVLEVYAVQRRLTFLFPPLFQGCISIEGIMEDQPYVVISNDCEELTLMETE